MASTDDADLQSNDSESQGGPDPADPDGAARKRRYKVKLAVSFLDAQEYVVEYAENLSRGGLFVAGAEHLTPLDTVTIRLDLPGFGSYDVQCRVAHILDAEQAARHNRTAGAGFGIMSAPFGFEKALSAYLLLLGGRHDATVLVVDDDTRRMLRSAGFRVRPCPEPDHIAATIKGVPSLIAIVAPWDKFETYQTALEDDELEELVVPMQPGDPAGDLLNTLDQRVRSLQHPDPA